MKTLISEAATPAAIQEHDFSNGIRGSQEQKYSLNIAGEFYVAAELNRRGIYASVTYGAAKNADVLAFNPQTHQTSVVEVKTTAAPNTKWLTGRHSLNLGNIQPHLFWVLVFLPEVVGAESGPRYFVFTSQELIHKVSATHDIYRREYQARNGYPFDDNQGVYSLKLEDAESMQSENRWDKILSGTDGK